MKSTFLRQFSILESGLEEAKLGCCINLFSKTIPLRVWGKLECRDVAGLGTVPGFVLKRVIVMIGISAASAGMESRLLSRHLFMSRGAHYRKSRLLSRHLFMSRVAHYRKSRLLARHLHYVKSGTLQLGSGLFSMTERQHDRRN